MASINRTTRTPPLLCFFLLLLFLAQNVSGQKKNTKHHAIPKPPEVTSPTVSSQAPAVPEDGSTPTKPAPAAEPIPVDSLGRSTPYGCVIGFLQAVNDNNLTKAAQYLDTKLPEEKAEELATQLKVVLDTGLSSSINGLSRDLLGNLTDDLRVSRERVGVAKIPNGNLEILLDRVKRPQEAPIWLFSPETLARVPAAYAEIKQPDFSRFFPAPLVRLQLLGLPLWRWLTILVAISLTILLSSAVTRLLFLIFRVFLDKKHVQGEEEMLARLKRPVLVLLLAVTVTVLATFSMSVLARHYWSTAARTLGTIGAAWLLVRLFDIGGDISARHFLATGAREKIAVISLARRLFKILALFVVVLLLLEGAGVNVTAMLAGLGIGGIALALAAQKTLEDLFGGISIIMRDSIRVGDYCRVADQTGIIEDIGLSSTRLRTLDRTVVSIPNAKIAQLNSENFALRDKFWFHHILPLRLDTSITQIESVLTGARKLLEQSPAIEKGTSRIHVIGLMNTSFQVEVFAYVLAPAVEPFLVRQQEILMSLLAAVSEAGARLAFPSQTLFLEQDGIAETVAPQLGRLVNTERN